MSHKAHIQKYLKSHSSELTFENTDAFKFLNLSWDYVLVVPVCGEAVSCIDQLLKQQHKHKAILVVVVVNRPEGHENSEKWYAENNQLIDHLMVCSKQSIKISNQINLLNNESGMDIMLLDFNHQPFSQKKGVGLARKIGADSALKLIGLGCIKNPWIFSTDADVELPEDYFSIVDNLTKSTAAVCLDFEHIGLNQQLNHFQNQYDFKLRYYQTGVRYTATRYDYIPLGSTLIVNADAYAHVRGFPSRSGGEDFYILNKLAKIGEIYQPKSPKVKINVRLSDRVPFGTGPAIAKIQAMEYKGEDYLFYNPECFQVLKMWRQGLISYFENQSFPVDDHGLNLYWKINDVLEKGFKQSKTKQRWEQFIHEWFDAFRMLKSVHFLTESIPLISQQALLNNSRYQQIINA